MYGGISGTVPVILNFGSTNRGECSVCGRGSPGKGHKVPTGLGTGRAELKSGEKKHFCSCSSRPMIPKCSSWSRHSAEIKLLKTKRKESVRTAQFSLSTTVIKTNPLMTYKAKVAVCSEIRTKHSTQSEQHVEF